MQYIVPPRVCWVLLGLAIAAPGSAAETINGAGSFASAPIYKTWAAEFTRSTGHVLAYQAIGSRAAIDKVTKREVDFGSSDVMVGADDLKKADLLMVPTAVTGLVPVVNLPQVSSNALKLNGDVLARIFLGQITQWDAREVRALNPDQKLPSLAIRLVVRSDFSGPSYYLSDYLSQVSPEWKKNKGVNARLTWPSGALQVTSTAAVSEMVRQTPGAIGCIDFNNAQDDSLTTVAMRNAEEHVVVAGVEGFREAVLHSTWFSTGEMSGTLANRTGARTWPLTMATYIAVPRVASRQANGELALQFVTWAYMHGDALARQAKFVPLPSKVQASAFREISKATGPNGEATGLKLVSTLMLK